MKKLCLSALLFVLLFNAHAQSTNPGRQVSTADTAWKTADSVFVPLKYCAVHKRSPVLACLLSVAIPGLGQVYNKQVLKGGILFGTFTLSFVAAEIHYAGNHLHPNDGATAALLLPMAVAAVYSIVDAPVTANWLNKTYHLTKKKRSLSAFSIQPGLINSSPDHYILGLNLVLR